MYVNKSKFREYEEYFDNLYYRTEDLQLYVFTSWI